jgi:invasion protein IalB
MKKTTTALPAALTAALTAALLLATAPVAAQQSGVAAGDAAGESAGSSADAAAPSAPQQTGEVANNTRFGDWLVSCQAVTVTRNVCRLVQEQILRDSNTLVARLIALPAADGGAVLLAQVPMGVYLPGGAVFRLETDEEAEQQEMIWQRCLGDVCEAAQALDAAMLEQMDAAGGILFGYRADVASEPIITRVDMTNFRAGLDALRVD